MTSRDKATTRRSTALGKGISSLIGQVENSQGSDAYDPPADSALVAEVKRLDIRSIDPNPHQPRKAFDEAAIRELSVSLKQEGLLQPIVVTRNDKEEGRYVLIAGERRWRASKLAGFESIPAIVKDSVTDDLLRLALIENIQRADLNVIEEAEAYASLIKDYGLTQEQCADRVGKDRSSVANALRLRSLPQEIQDDIIEERLTMGHGRAILSLEEKKLMLRARDVVIKKSLSVRQTEQLCKTFKEGRGDVKPPNIKDEADLQYVAESLRGFLHTKVRLAGNTQRGRIEISYFSAAELERILTLMGHKF